jgi:hypothetical protein
VTALKQRKPLPHISAKEAQQQLRQQEELKKLQELQQLKDFEEAEKQRIIQSTVTNMPHFN